MTDKEIIKALECCIKPTNGCENCPYYKKEECFDMAKRDALNLINRQQAEIQALRENIHNRKSRENKLRSKIKSFKATINELQHEREILIEDIHHSADQINEQIEEIEKQKRNTDVVIENYQNLCDRYIEARAEAIKEFAERLKEEITTRIVELKATKSKYVKENYKCLSCEYIAKIRGEIEFLESLKEFIDNLVKEMVGE